VWKWAKLMEAGYVFSGTQDVTAVMSETEFPERYIAWGWGSNVGDHCRLTHETLLRWLNRCGVLSYLGVGRERPNVWAVTSLKFRW
jgi:hypothetical protein